MLYKYFNKFNNFFSQNDGQVKEIKSKKIDRASKSADVAKGENTINIEELLINGKKNNLLPVVSLFVVNKPEFEFHNDERLEKDSKSQKPYATPKRAERKSECQITDDPKSQRVKRIEEYTNQVRILIQFLHMHHFFDVFESFLFT